jgi:hypothetical protein
MQHGLAVPVALLRIGAGSSIVAGVLLPIGFLLHPAGEDATFGTDPYWVPAHSVLWAAYIFAIFGWIGVYLGQSAKAGKLGLIGFIVVTLGTALTTWIFSSDVTFVPVLATEAPGLFAKIFTGPHIALGAGSVATWVIGNVLVGLSVMRAKVYPWWAGLLPILGTVPIPIGYFAAVSVKVIAVPAAIVGMGQVVLGLRLLSIAGQSASGQIE